MYKVLERPPYSFATNIKNKTPLKNIKRKKKVLCKGTLILIAWESSQSL